MFNLFKIFKRRKVPKRTKRETFNDQAVALQLNFVQGQCKDCLRCFNCPDSKDNMICSSFSPDSFSLELARLSFMNKWKFFLPIIRTDDWVFDAFVVIEFQEKYRNRTTMRTVPKDEFISLGFLNHTF